MMPSLDDQPLSVDKHHIDEIITRLEPYLREKLLPFWLENSPDKECGGFLTYFDQNGAKTGKTMKTLIMQLRTLYTFSSALRAGFGDGRCLEESRRGIDFILEHFWDRKYRGWYWTTEREGEVRDNSKIMYGHCFGIYALAEYGLASGDPRGREYADKTFDIIQERAHDARAGGYWEMFARDWSRKPGGATGGDRKTLDVHMHLMEAYTTLYELTKKALHRSKLEEVIDLIIKKMLHPEYGTGMAQFDRDFHPLKAIIFQNVWGSDRPPEDEAGRALDNTNYGHNIELAWLLAHALNILELEPEPYRSVLQKLVDHACLWGLDKEYGGIFVEGPNQGHALQTHKEFWQQAEALVGFLDATLLFRKQRYWDAFAGVLDFVWKHMINHDVGEWYALLDRRGNVIWDCLGHEWKISYHTVRCIIQSLIRLRRLRELLG